jgi:hypothetical protein
MIKYSNKWSYEEINIINPYDNLNITVYIGCQSFKMLIAHIQERKEKGGTKFNFWKMVPTKSSSATKDQQ